MVMISTSQRPTWPQSNLVAVPVDPPGRVGPANHGAPRFGPVPLFMFSGRPGGLAVGEDHSIYVSDTDSASVWRVEITGSAHRVAGPFHDGDPYGERLVSPAGMALSAHGSLLVADTRHHRICAVDPDGSVRIVAGGASGYQDGTAGQAMFRFPSDLTVGPDGTCYVADTGNDRIRAISPDQTVTTVAGSIYDYGNGRGPHARFRRPSALDVDPEGTVYIADTGNNALRRLFPDGEVTTLAGSPPGGRRDGPGAVAGFHWPSGIAAGAGGSTWVADYGNSALRWVSSSGDATTVLEVPGLAWPTTVAALPEGGAVVGVAGLDGERHRHGYLLVVGDDS